DGAYGTTGRIRAAETLEQCEERQGVECTLHPQIQEAIGTELRPVIRITITTVRRGAPGSIGKPRLQDSGQQTAGCKPTPEDVLGKKLSKQSCVKALGCQQMMSSIIHKWKKLGTVVNLPSSDDPTRITPRAQLQLNQELKKDPRTTSVELQASLGTIKVSDMYSEAMANPSDHLPANKVAGSAAKTQTSTVSQNKKHIVRHVLFIKLQKAMRITLLTRTRKKMRKMDEEEGSSGASSVSFDGHLESTNLVPPSLASEKP
ncbi:phosphopantothenoylcysteine decarboxylase subunit VHS3-like, partial [Clarias magur]